MANLVCDIALNSLVASGGSQEGRGVRTECRKRPPPDDDGAIVPEIGNATEIVNAPETKNAPKIGNAPEIECSRALSPTSS